MGRWAGKDDGSCDAPRSSITCDHRIETKIYLLERLGLLKTRKGVFKSAPRCTEKSYELFWALQVRLTSLSSKLVFAQPSTSLSVPMFNALFRGGIPIAIPGLCSQWLELRRAHSRDGSHEIHVALRVSAVFATVFKLSRRPIDSHAEPQSLQTYEHPEPEKKPLNASWLSSDTSPFAARSPQLNPGLARRREI